MDKYKKILSFIIRFAVTVGIFVWIFTYAIDYDDYIVLKDNSEIRGNITFQSADDSRVEIIVAGKKRIYQASEIADQKNIDRKAVHFGFFKIWKQLNVPVYLLFASIFLVNVFLCTIRLRWLLGSQGIPVTYANLAKINFIGVFFNNFLPGFTGGDLVRAYYLAKNARQKTCIVVAVLMDRIIGLSALVILASCILIFNIAKREFFVPCLVIYSALVGIVLGALVIFNLPERMYVNRQKLIFRVLDAFCRYRKHPRLLVYSVLLSLFVHGITNLAFFGFAKALGISHVAWYAYFIYVPVALLFMALPISISGWGVGEATFGFLFVKVGVVFEKGVVLSLLFRLSNMLLGIVGGVLLLVSGGKNVYHDG